MTPVGASQARSPQLVVVAVELEDRVVAAAPAQVAVEVLAQVVAVA